jgi:hypothetical protein
LERGLVVRVAVWIDAETELSCGYILLPGRAFTATGSSFPILALAIERQLRSLLPPFVCFEVAYLHLGCLRRPIHQPFLRHRLEQASVVA